MDYDEGFTLKDILRKYPQLKQLPEFNPERYANSSEDMFEKIAKYCTQLELKAERFNLGNDKYNVDFKIVSEKTNKILFYADLEQDNTGMFNTDGTVIYWQLTIPIEKQKYFYLEKPFFYIKFSKDVKWCYILDGWAAKQYLKEVTKLRKIPTINKEEPRKLLEISSSQVFNRIEPFGVHRCPIQDWLKAIRYFYDMRYKWKQRSVKEW